MQNLASQLPEVAYGMGDGNLFFRLWAVGLNNGNSCTLSITQGELGDTLGLTIVHTNRMLQDLRPKARRSGWKLSGNQNEK